jgi:hypothetical protein
MKLASVVVAAAFVALAGYTLYTHMGMGGDSGPVAEVVTLPAKRPGVPEPVPAVRPSAAVETPTTQVVTQTTNPNRAPSEPVSRAVAVPNDRASLARALQRELQRVGCYDGEISGNWSTSTRMAMKAFTDRVNASLPVDAPDYILLSLVQRHEGKACGTGCPTGQLLSDEGRCVPSAVLAKAAPAKPSASAAEAKAAGSASGESKEGSSASVSSASSWAPAAGLAAGAGAAAILAGPEVRGSSTTSSARSTAGLPGPRPPETAAAEPREERWRYSASRESESRPTASRADVDADPAESRDRASNQRTARAEDAPPRAESSRRDEPPARKVRKKYKQPKFVRQFLRSMKGVMANLPF